MDISGPGCNPVAAEAQTPQPTISSLAAKTATSEEEQNNTANTQRRNPRRSELKRYYTIGEFSFKRKSKICLLKRQDLSLCLFVYIFLVNCCWPQLALLRCRILVLMSNYPEELTCFIYLALFTRILSSASFFFSFFIVVVSYGQVLKEA